MDVNVLLVTDAGTLEDAVTKRQKRARARPAPRPAPRLAAAVAASSGGACMHMQARTSEDCVGARERGSQSERLRKKVLENVCEERLSHVCLAHARTRGLR